MEQIIKSGLHFSRLYDGGYACEELAALPQAFLARWGEERVRAQIERYLSVLRRSYFVREPEEKEAPTEAMYAKGATIFDDVRARISCDGMNLFQEFLFWLSEWDYYHPALTSQTRTDRERGMTAHSVKSKIARELLLPVLPEAVDRMVRDMEILSLAINFGHFAVLFGNTARNTRRVVTDSQLFELRGVYGYSYLDITPDGKPITRSRCDQGGERAFFDGVRLMSHERFLTCAPKTVMIDGGYKVNSTHCTIANGQLYELIDTDDRVARTTGALFGCWADFSRKEQAESFQMAEASGARMRASDNTVMLDGKPLKPLGRFSPSAVTLLDSGFSLYDWSAYSENITCRFDHVLAVDDSSGWLDKLLQALGSEIPKLETFCTKSGEEALARILETRPDAVLLDMHLTPDERFEGLWVANKLIAHSFTGAIMITSGYSEPALTAMSTLIKGKVQTPGKDIERIRLALAKQS